MAYAQQRRHWTIVDFESRAVSIQIGFDSIGWRVSRTSRGLMESSLVVLSSIPGARFIRTGADVECDRFAAPPRPWFPSINNRVANAVAGRLGLIGDVFAAFTVPSGDVVAVFYKACSVFISHVSAPPIPTAAGRPYLWLRHLNLACRRRTSSDEGRKIFLYLTTTTRWIFENMDR